MAINPRPSAKTSATGAAGAAAVVTVWVCSLFGVEMPPEVAAAVAVLAPLLVAWLVPARVPGRRERIDP